MDRWKSRGGKSQRGEEEKEREERRCRCAKGRKVAIHYVFPMICGSGDWNRRLAKAAGAEPSGKMRDEKLHTFVVRGTFRRQNVQNTPFSDHFGIEKVHAAVARSTCPSQNVQKTPCSDHVWKLRCRKSVRRFGVKHVSKSKCTKHTMLGPLKMWCRKSARCCGAKHISKSKCFKKKHNMFGPLLDVQKSQNVLVRGCQLCIQLSIFEGSLAELLRFWCCQLRKLRKSRRIVSFFTLSSSKIEEVSQNCCVFDVAKFKNWRSVAE